MLRARLGTNLLFNLLLAVWVLHDARTRHARKPLFAALLTLLWGPLGVSLWASDRPLALGEHRTGVGPSLARAFALAWTALVPAIFVLVTEDVRDRSAVPGSLGRTVGVPLASALVTCAIWIGPAFIALVLGGWSRRTASPESGTSAVTAGRPSLEVAVALAGLIVALVALASTR